MAGHIVVGVDGSAAATAAVEWAAVDAQRRSLSLSLVHVCEQRPGAHVTGYCSSVLALAGDRARELADGVPIATELLMGNVIDRLLAESETADSVVLGSRGLGGFAGLVVGSVSLAVAGHAMGPVVTVRSPDGARHDRVVVGYDASEHAEAAMEYAIAYARAYGARLQSFFAWRIPVFSPYPAAYNSRLVDVYQEETLAVADSVARWREKNPDVEIAHESWTGHPAGVLAKAGESADLVVVGSRGRGGFASAVLGSVSHGVLHHVTCPVAVVRPRKEET